MNDSAARFLIGGVDPLSDLLDVLNLRRATDIPDEDEAAASAPPQGYHERDEDIFIGRSQPQRHGRAFGGQVLAQSIIAAGRTVEDVDGPPRFIHSMHGYFLRPGDANAPIRFAVERLRDGNSFSARRVHAIQYGHPILSMISSFQTHSDGLDHQIRMPSAPDPQWLPTAAQELERQTGSTTASYPLLGRPIDMRHCQGSIYLQPGRQAAADQSVWMRTIGTLPDDPLLHAAVMAYASDYTLLESILRRHKLSWSDPRLRPASLDHSMWFHRPGRIDDWVLYTQLSPTAQGGRGLGVGYMFSEDGTLLATVGQEGMVRVKSDAVPDVQPDEHDQRSQEPDDHADGPTAD